MIAPESGRALLSLAERLSGFADLRALPVPDGQRDPLDGRSQPCQRRAIRRVPIARNDLGRHDFRVQPHGRQRANFERIGSLKHFLRRPRPLARPAARRPAGAHGLARHRRCWGGPR